MSPIHFKDLVELAAGAIADLPTSYEATPDTLNELLAQENLNPLSPDDPFPRLTLDEITIDIPVYFHIAPGQTETLTASQLMTTLPSSLFPKSVKALSHFRISLKLYSDS